MGAWSSLPGSANISFQFWHNFLTAYLELLSLQCFTQYRERIPKFWEWKYCMQFRRYISAHRFHQLLKVACHHHSRINSINIRTGGPKKFQWKSHLIDKLNLNKLVTTWNMIHPWNNKFGSNNCAVRHKINAYLLLTHDNSIHASASSNIEKR